MSIRSKVKSSVNSDSQPCVSDYLDYKFNIHLNTFMIELTASDHSFRYNCVLFLYFILLLTFFHKTFHFKVLHMDIMGILSL